MSTKLVEQFTQPPEVMYCTITVPASSETTANNLLIATLLASGLDDSTGAAPTADRLGRIIGVVLRGHTAALHYRGQSVSKLTSKPIVIGIAELLTEPSINFHKRTLVRSSTTAQEVVAVCYMR